MSPMNFEIKIKLYLGTEIRVYTVPANTTLTKFLSILEDKEKSAGFEFDQNSSIRYEIRDPYGSTKTTTLTTDEEWRRLKTEYFMRPNIATIRMFVDPLKPSTNSS